MRCEWDVIKKAGKKVCTKCNRFGLLPDVFLYFTCEAEDIRQPQSIPRYMLVPEMPLKGIFIFKGTLMPGEKSMTWKNQISPFKKHCCPERASQVTLVVKNQVANAGDVRSLGWEDPLEEGMATHSSILVWRIPWTEEPGGSQSMESQRVGHD